MVPHRDSLFGLLFALLFVVPPVSSQSRLTAIDIPPNFNLDRQNAARLRPAFLSESEEPKAGFLIGTSVLRRLVQQVPGRDRPSSFSWELRITKQPRELNAFSSPEGTIYVDRSLAQILGGQSGLWAAALSHEIAHILHRDWARRYLYQKSMRNDDAAMMSLGDGATPGSWMDSAKAASLASTLSQLLETNADADGLMLMARAGYHPDFMFSLHHLLRVHSPVEVSDSLHPDWSSREESLRAVYIAAGHEYERLWPDTSESPGGSPPVIVSTGEQIFRKRGAGRADIFIPLRCSNLSGAVEVVLRVRDANAVRSVPEADSPSKWRQLTGCTSDITGITFRVEASDLPAHGQAAIYVKDDRGTLIAASDTFRLRK